MCVGDRVRSLTTIKSSLEKGQTVSKAVCLPFLKLDIDGEVSHERTTLKLIIKSIDVRSHHSMTSLISTLKANIYVKLTLIYINIKL